MATEEDFGLPNAKRQRLELPDAATHVQSSRLFSPFRTIGLVSPTSVPFTSVPLGKSTFQITTSVGRSLQTYDVRRGLSLVFLSRPQCPEKITATCAYRDRVFLAWGSGTSGGPRGIWVQKRGRVIQEFDINNTVTQNLDRILVFGTWVIGCGSKAIEIWRQDSGEHYTTILPSRRLPYSDERVYSGCVCTLPTFLNKIFVGCHDGSVEIYNISTGKLVYSLPPHVPTSGGVTALCPVPAVSLLAVAYTDGSIVIMDVQFGEIMISFKQADAKCPITSISFRTDGAGAGKDGRQDGVMATSSINSGDITLWDLTQGGKLAGVLRGAHELIGTVSGSGINKVEFLPGQPVIISTGLDNSLRSWVFDQTPFSPLPRPLHSRSGHAAPITKLGFLPAASDGSEAAGKWLLSAGHDRSLWGFSLRKDGQSSELSQGNIRSKAKKQGKAEVISSEDFKAAPIVAMACSLNRDGGMGAVGGPIWTNPKSSNAEESGLTGWESILTAHVGDRFARTWFWGRRKAGRWAFETHDRQPVTAVAVTACGTFAVIGSAGGSLDMFNLQSGLHRQRFPPKLTPAQGKQLRLQQLQSDDAAVKIERGHRHTISGIVVDSLNRTMVSTDLDGDVIFWDFATGRIVYRTSLERSSATALRYNAVSGLIAMACDDLCIRVLDIETKRIVRELWGCVGQIYDHCFSHDGRWIVACSMDSVVRIFDLATGHLVDAFKVATCTGVAFSSTGEFLATAHAGEIGINIWNNKSLFAHIPTYQIDEDHDIIDLSTTPEFEAVSQLAIANESTSLEIDLENSGSRSAIEQLDTALLTLSLVPQSRWQTLLNLDVIKERNKPIAPPEKPRAAPFFLGSANGMIGKQLNGDSPGLLPPPAAGSASHEASRISQLTSFAPSSSSEELTHHLSIFQATADPSTLSTFLKDLNPSSADLALRTLSLSELSLVISALTARLRQRRDFELVNTWMSLILRLHSEFISEVPEVQNKVLEFRSAVEGETKRLEALVGWCRGVGDFLRSGR